MRMNKYDMIYQKEKKLKKLYCWKRTPVNWNGFFLNALLQSMKIIVLQQLRALNRNHCALNSLLNTTIAIFSRKRSELTVSYY